MGHFLKFSMLSKETTSMELFQPALVYFKKNPDFTLQFLLITNGLKEKNYFLLSS